MMFILNIVHLKLKVQEYCVEDISHFFLKILAEAAKCARYIVIHRKSSGVLRTVEFGSDLSRSFVPDSLWVS